MSRNAVTPRTIIVRSRRIAATTTISCRPPAIWRIACITVPGPICRIIPCLDFSQRLTRPRLTTWRSPTAAGLLSGPKLRFNYSQGILEPTIAEQRGSIYDVLKPLPNGQQLIAQYGITPVGAQQARTYEAGVDQNVLGTRMLLHGGYFHRQFTNQIEFVDAPALLQLGVPPAVEQVIANTSFGAYINSLSFHRPGRRDQRGISR